MESRPKRELIRIACYEGQLTFDPTGKAKGRGVYLCPNEECMQKAVKKKALQRSLRTEIGQEELDRLFEEIRDHG